MFAALVAPALPDRGSSRLEPPRTRTHSATMRAELRGRRVLNDHPSGAGEELLLALRAGNDAAYQELILTYGGRLLAVCRRYLANEEDAKDALQDALIQAFRALPRFEGGCHIATWLHKIAVNASLMKLRSKRSRPEESIEPLLPQFKDDGHAVAPAVEWADSFELVRRSEVRQRVREAIQRLPETYRTVLLLRDIEELDTAEAATLLGITENAVKIRLHRARQALRELLDPELRGEARTP